MTADGESADKQQEMGSSETAEDGTHLGVAFSSRQVDAAAADLARGEIRRGARSSRVERRRREPAEDARNRIGSQRPGELQKTCGPAGEGVQTNLTEAAASSWSGKSSSWQHPDSAPAPHHDDVQMRVQLELELFTPTLVPG
ncbi:hypothetical protein ZWY2020_005710 [Hordeum vulgare]|nr:hypothetical protein ZWY2020_005710 [Hordeum vulgare]